jgi:hypothetical protein
VMHACAFDLRDLRPQIIKDDRLVHGIPETRDLLKEAPCSAFLTA